MLIGIVCHGASDWVYGLFLVLSIRKTGVNTLAPSKIIRYTLLRMSYVLVIGIIFAALPIIVIEILAHVVFFGMLRDDEDMGKLLSFAIGLTLFGLVLIGIHFGITFL